MECYIWYCMKRLSGNTEHDVKLQLIIMTEGVRQEKENSDWLSKRSEFRNADC